MARRGSHACTRSFVERTLASFTGAVEHALEAEEYAKIGGLLQGIDARVKVPGIFALIVAAALSRKLWVIAALFVLALLLAKLSRVRLGSLAKRVWVAVLLFTGLIALPAPFVTPGRILWRVSGLGWPMTSQGLTSAAFLILRVETAATFSALLILSTPWNGVLKALRVMRVPAVLVVIMEMTYRYVFLLLQSAQDMFDARRSRIARDLSGPERRRIATASAGVLMSKSFQLSSDVYAAMQSRGFSGEIHTLDDLQPRRRDWIALLAFCCLAAAAFWLGR